MTVYESDKIKLAPVATTYDIKIERVISEGQEGVAGVYYLSPSNCTTSDNIQKIVYFYPLATTASNKIRESSITVESSFGPTVQNVIIPFLQNSSLKNIYNFSLHTTGGYKIKVEEKEGYYGIGLPAIWLVSSDSPVKRFAFTVVTATTYNPIMGQKAIPPEIEYIESPNTFVDRMGKLHIGKDLLPGDIIRIKSTSTYINPSGETETMEDTQSVVVI